MSYPSRLGSNLRRSLTVSSFSFSVSRIQKKKMSKYCYVSWTPFAPN